MQTFQRCESISPVTFMQELKNITIRFYRLQKVWRQHHHQQQIIINQTANLHTWNFLLFSKPYQPLALGSDFYIFGGNFNLTSYNYNILYCNNDRTKATQVSWEQHRVLHGLKPMVSSWRVRQYHFALNSSALFRVVSGSMHLIGNHS